MKYIYSIVLFFTLSLVSASDSLRIAGIKKGSELNYELDNYGDKSSLIIKIITLNDTISFSYFYKDSTSGIITILPETIKNATGLKCSFGHKENFSTSQNFISLFLSKKMYNMALNYNIQSIEVGLEKPKKIKLQNKFEYKTELDIHNLFKSKEALIGDGYTINGFANKLNELRFLTEQNLLDLAAVKDPNFALITYIDMGWKLTLKSINNF